MRETITIKMILIIDENKFDEAEFNSLLRDVRERDRELRKKNTLPFIIGGALLVAVVVLLLIILL